MPSTKNGGNIKFGIDFEANQASLNKLKKSLQDLQKIKFGKDFDGNRQEFNEVKARITEIQNLMKTAFNPTLNTSNITAFKNELEKSGMSLKQIQSDFSRFGSTGDRAFNQLTTSVLTTNLKLKETNSLIDSMGKTMVNTVKWGVASSVMNTFTQSVQGAFQYVQSLEKSLTNIRIVTGDSTEKMAQFAEQANRSAQALGRSTLDYTKASLTFYQQGLNDQDVQARTEATLKAQNITGAGQQMADYLTSVWNGYKVANEEAELYVDKLAAVADSSASDMSQLAIAMSKVASTANTMGVDVDQLNAQIATVVATTRQAPESVGTAFKTIYTRMNDIKTGSDEAEISLGRYSGTMASLGFNVLDTTGHLRDTGQVMEEIGGRWQDLTREQQIYLAQTMGGQRQVNQLMALFDNWTTYSELLNTSLESEGTLTEKNARYMESLGAKMEQLGAAGERVKDALIDSDSMKTIIEALTSVTNLVANLFETMGSGQTILLALGSTMTQLFSGTIAKEINNVIVNMQNMKTNAQTIKNQLEMTKMVQEVGKDTKGGILVADRMAEIQQYYSVMDEASINNQKNLIRERAQLQNNIQTINQEREEVEKIAKLLDENTILDWSATQGDSFENINIALGNMETSLKEIKELSSKDLFTGIFDSNATTESTFITSFNKFIEDYQKIDTTKANELAQAFNKFTSNQMSGGAFFNKLDIALDEAKQKTKELSETIDKSGQALSNATNKAETLDKAIKDGADSAKQLFDVTNAVKMISAIGQISSSLMTIWNLKTIWDDKDVSTGEKIAKIVSSMAFVVPSLVTAAKNLKVSGLNLLKNEAVKLATLKLQTKELERQVAIENFKKSGKGIGAIGQLTKEVDEAKQHLEGLQKNAISGSALIGEGFTGLLGTLGSMLPILLGIGVAVVAVYGAYKEWNKEVDAAKKASEIAADTKKTYDDLKTSLQDVKSALEDLHSAENNLDGLTKGTQEWRDALQQCNDKVLELISNYPELAQYVTNENGQLKLNAEGEQAYLDQLQAGVQNARNASYIASSNSREASARAAAANIGHNSSYIDQNNVQVGRQYASADNVLKVVDAIDKAVNEGASLKDGLASLKDEIIEETHLSGEVVSSILKNEDALLQLRTQLQQNETADKLMYETMAQSTLANNSTFKGMDELGQQVASAIGGVDLEKRINDIQKDLIADMSGLNMSRFTSGSDDTVQEILKRLNKAQGTNWRMDSNAVRGGEGDRTLAFLDQAGQLHTYTRQQIASTIATKEALENLGTSAENASKILNNIDNKTSNNTNEAIKQWVAGQDMTAINREGLKQLQGTNISDIIGEDEAKALAEAWNLFDQNGQASIEKLNQNWNNSIFDTIKSFDNVAENATRSVKDAWEDIQGTEGLEKATLDFRQMVVGDMQEALAEGGGQALKNLKNFYGKISDFNKFEQAVSDVDLSKGAEELAVALKEAGIETEFTTEELQAWIAIQREAAKVISPQENYKNIHDITNKLKQGDTVDSDKAIVLQEAGVDIDTYFQRMADGSIKLKVKAEEFQEYINQLSFEPFKAEMDDLQNKINAINSFKNSEYSSEQGGNFEDFSEIAANAGTSIGNGRTVAIGVDQEKFQVQLQYVNLLDLQQEKREQIEDIQNRMAQKQQLSFQDYKTIAQLIKQHGNEYQNLNTLEEEYLNRLKTIKEETATLQFNSLEELNQAHHEGNVSDEDYQMYHDTLLDERLQKLNVTREAYDSYLDKVKESSEVYKDESENEEEFLERVEDLTLGLIELQKGMEDLSKVSKETFEKIANGEYTEGFEELRNSLEKVLNVDLDDSFIQNNLTDIQALAQGDIDALNRLRIAYVQALNENDFELSPSIDREAFNQDLAAFQLEVANASDYLSGLQIGATLDDAPFYESLQEMAIAAGIGADDVNAILQGIGYEPEVTEVTIPIGDFKQAEGGGSYTATYQNPYTGQMATVTYTDDQFSQFANEENVTIPVINGKSRFKGGAGRSIGSYSKPSSGGGGKGKKGSGGSGKAKEPNRVKGETRKSDRYRDNTVQANKLANSMERLQKQQEKLSGKGTLDNLEKQLKILEQQNKNIKERISLQRDEQAELANNLKKYGATFKNGTLSNYFKVHAKIMDEYNKKLAKWNSASSDWQEKNKEFLNNAKEVMDNALKDLERYDKLQQEIAKSIQESIDNAQEQINTKLKQFEVKVEASLDLANAKRDWNKFKRDIIDEVREDDILGLNQFRFADLASYFNDAGTGSIQQLQDRLKTLVGNDGSLNRNIFSAVYEYQDLRNQIQHMTLTDRQSWLEEIEKVSKDLEGQMEGFKDIIDEIKESIFDTINAVQDAFDEQMDEYEYLGDLINHNMKIAEMMYGDQAYDQMAKYYDKIEQNNNKQLEFLRQQKDLWYSRMHEEQARMARIASQQGTDSNAYKESRDRFKEYEKHWMDSVKNLNSMIEDSLDNIIDKYANAINDIFLKFELNLGNGKTFDDIGDEWDMINDKADMFLDKINSAYQIEKLQNAFEDAIGDNEGDIAAQQTLNNLMEQQLAYLKDKDKLTQYDVDRANTLLQIEIKRLALQQARSNKNKLRLRRDSQGNYTYQYTADTEAMNKAEQDLADARISLYNSDKAAYVDNLSAIQKSANDIKDKLEDIWTDENLSKEEKLQKSYELEKYYGEKINDLLAENASIRNNLIDSSFEDLARIYNMSVEDLKGLPQDQQDAIFKNLIPQANSAVAQMVQSLAGAGGFSGFFDNLLAPLTQAFDDRVASMAEVQEQSQQVLGDITSDYDTLIGQTERLLDNNQQLVDLQKQKLTQVQNELLYAENILKAYQEIKDAAAEALKLGYQIQEKDALGVLGVSQKTDQEATDKQNTTLQDYLGRETSTSDLGSDYTPYEPNWHSDNFMAGLESSNVDESSILTGQTNNTNNNLNNSVQTLPQTNINNVLDSINSNIFDSINNTLNNILETNQDYYVKSLARQEAIEKAIIANQTVHIDADFPNARDVSQIIDAINNLTLVAAQKAGKQ